MRGVIILSSVGMVGACIMLLIMLLRLTWINSHDSDGWEVRKRTDSNDRFWEED